MGMDKPDHNACALALACAGVAAGAAAGASTQGDMAVGMVAGMADKCARGGLPYHTALAVPWGPLCRDVEVIGGGALGLLLPMWQPRWNNHGRSLVRVPGLARVPGRVPVRRQVPWPGGPVPAGWPVPALLEGWGQWLGQRLEWVWLPVPAR